MEEIEQTTWKSAWSQSPGPKKRSEYIVLYMKGVCMGSADIIPGVSGGTIALIMGIYQSLLQAIQSFDAQVIRTLLRFELKQALEKLHLRFLLTLVFGIATAVVALSHLIHYLLNSYAVSTWSFFFGLLLASILVIGKGLQKSLGSIVALVLGAILGFVLVGMIPVQTPEESWFVFLCGMFAICAMILPGISGAFILLILGKYEYVTSALKNPFVGESIAIILVFCAGALLGILGFSRILNYFLQNYYNTTIAVLTGLMAGSLRKIWPWKNTLETITIRNKVHVLREENVLPSQYGGEFFVALVLLLIGFAIVLLLEKFAGQKETKNSV
ncbi:MAG: DUF368 domain-containing protein [Spirochaetota bacterium]